MSADLVRFPTDSGGEVTIEIGNGGRGFSPAGRGRGEIQQASGTFESALQDARRAAKSALDVFRSADLAPDDIEIEFGVKFTTEAGAVIARTALDAHLTVKLTWSPKNAPAGP